MNGSSTIKTSDLLKFTKIKRIPVILQAEATECGLACLAMIAHYHGYKTDLNSLRNKHSISSHGATLKQIMLIASRISLSSRALKLELDQVRDLSLPCILHWDMKHFVVLTKVKADSLTINDPAIGEREITFAEADLSFTGVALELSPSMEFEKKDERKNITFSNFWSNISGLKLSLTQIVGLSLLLQAFSIASPYYMQIVVDDVILRRDFNLLSVLAMGFGLLLLIESATTLLRQYINLTLSNLLSVQMSANVFHHLIRLPTEYFFKRHIGDLTSRFGSLNSIQTILTEGTVAVLIDGLMAILTLIVMFAYDAKLSLVVLLVVMIYAILRWSLYRPIRLLNEEAIVAAASENSHFMESMRAIQTIKLFEQESDREGQWQNKLVHKVNKGMQISRWDISFSIANKLLFGIENIIIIYLGAQAVMGEAISIGMLYAFMSYKGKFMGSINNLIEKWIEFKMLDLHFNRLADIVITKRDPFLFGGNSADFEKLDTNLNRKLELRIEGLSYRYSADDQPIFKNISLHIQPKEKIAIIGPSGSGKSTLLMCMMGFMKGYEGQVMVGDSNIFDAPNYRGSIAAVLQNDQLLSGTISENIACFDVNIDYKKVAESAHRACIHNEIMSWPMQYNTLVGDMGSSLSGGQKQRIILARALYRNPNFLFMDEATSHLDINNEININFHIKDLGITQIIVAHRLETILSADRIFELNKGSLNDVTEKIKAQHA